MQPHSLTIRPATAADAHDIAVLAHLDDRPRPGGEVLIALADGAPVAALGNGHAVADPFTPTADVVELLRLRAAQR